MTFSLRPWLFAGLLLLLPRLAAAITIDLNYSYDTSGFFTGANSYRQAYLQDAVDSIASHLTDTLSAIAPSGENTWTDTFFDPSDTNTLISGTNLSISQDVIVIYVGAQDMGGGGELGFGGPGGYSASGSQAWLNTVEARGQTGALASTPTDFGPWGGSISFDSSADWYFGASTADLTGTEDDFFSVAEHELGHVLGIGTAGSWNAQVFDGMFTGANAEAAYGGPVPLDGADEHWAAGTESTLPGTDTEAPVVMQPALLEGTRRYFTTLDYAGLEDIGWQVEGIPEPGAARLSLLCGVLAVGMWRRRERRSSLVATGHPAWAIGPWLQRRIPTRQDARRGAL